MKSGYTHISAIIDRSGSMASIKTDTEGGFNSFLTAQKALPGEATISLTTFDTYVETVYRMKPIQEVPAFTLIPRGMTALLDAVGMTIRSLGEKLAAMDESDRPEKVIIVIVTDGEENNSQEFTFDAIKQLITQQTETYKWEFVFLGANQDAIQVGGRLGVPKGKSMSYACSSRGIGSTYDSMTGKVTRMRSAAPGTAMEDFDLCDRSAAMADDDPSC